RRGPGTDHCDLSPLQNYQSRSGRFDEGVRTMLNVHPVQMRRQWRAHLGTDLIHSPLQRGVRGGEVPRSDPDRAHETISLTPRFSGVTTRTHGAKTVLTVFRLGA